MPELDTGPVARAEGGLDLPEFAPSLTPPSLGVYWRTLRHLSASQLVCLVRRRLLDSGGLAKPAGGQSRLRMPPRPPKFAEWKPAWSRETLETQAWEFLNVPRAAASPIPWSGEDLPKLWYYHLNYCHFLNVDLTDSEDEGLLRSALAIVLDWIDRNRTGRETGWEPYPLSSRIVNWLKLLTRNAERLKELGENAAPGGSAIDRIAASLRVQTLTLERRLEKDLRANHLLKNAKALIFAGALLEAPESPRWLEKGRKLLKAELAEQVLADGGHFERSPMYHAHVLDDLLDLQALTSTSAETVGYGPMLSGRIAQMAGFLRAILHPDGEIPLLNDSALGIARPTQELLRLAGRPASPPSVRGITVLAAAGYAVIRDLGSESCLIFDGGPLGPGYQLGHAHCDVLSYELSLEGRRVVVDTGASTYERGPERHYERSTAAHNTLRIDGEEQAEIWAAFRVGRRPRVGRLDGGDVQGCQVIRGTHFGYRHLGVTHTRVVIRTPESAWLVLDSLTGKGRHRVESFVHFHPDVTLVPDRTDIPVERLSGGPESRGDVPPESLYGSEEAGGVQEMRSRWTLQFGDNRYFFMTLGEGELRLARSWYSPEFGLRQSRPVILWTWTGDLPATMLYAFVPADATPPAVRRVDANTIEVAGATIRLNN
jgi:uncharacterized heparinase superfamily protein